MRELIRDVGPGGDHMVTCDNSLAGYLQPEDVVSLGVAVQEFGRYPIGA